MIKRMIAKIIRDSQVVMTIEKNMLFCEFGSLDRGNITDIVDWGIYANRGSIIFIDKDGFFNNQNVNSAEILECIVQFFLTDKSKETLIATFSIDNARINEETREVSIELISQVIKLEKEELSSIVYPFYDTSFLRLVTLVNDKSPNYKFNIGDDSQNLSSIVGCPYIGKEKIWNVINKICQGSMSRCIERENGEFEITSSFPNRKPIVLNPNNIIDVSNSSFVKLKNASIDVTKRSRKEEQILDGSSQYFSIEWGDFTEILQTSGINLYKIEEETTGNKTSVYAEGQVKIETPYKIYSVFEDLSIITRRFTAYEGGSDISQENDEKNVLTSITSEPSISNDRSTIIASFLRNNIFTYNIEPEVIETYLRLISGTIRFPVSTFIDDGKYSLNSQNDLEDKNVISSNDFIQDISYYIKSDGRKIELGRHILDEANKRYSKGIECFEIECLFNDYYYDDGSLAFDGEDLSTHFKKYDVVIPYVFKKGKRIPLRINQDGTPKKFRVIGICYSYDGLLKQRLQLHEERYDVD